MYGFLRPANKYLNAEAKKAYARIYCGQCAALHDEFGYVSRVLTSYDAAFFGLLIAAQRDEPETVDRRRCALFPKKIDVCAANDPAARVSAALAVCFSAMKLKDKQQDRDSSVLTMLERIFNQATKKASDILSSYGVPDTIVADTLQSQYTIEQRRACEIIEYARPTERLMSELLRSTATISGRVENSDILARIGTCLGRIIYLIDSCVDLSDDLVKQEFNALLAIYATEGGELRRDTGDQITGLIVQSLMEIKALIPRLDLNRHQAIIGNVLVVGIPLMIRQQLSRSMSRLKKQRPALLEYAPHATLIAALCILTERKAEALEWVWGISSGKDNEYGLACTDRTGKAAGFDICINPFYYIGCSNKEGCDKGCENFLAIICQAPKAALSAVGVWLAVENGVPKIAEARRWSKIEKKRRGQEKDRRNEEKRHQDNEAYLENTTKDLNKYEHAIQNKLLTLSVPSTSFPFGKKIQRLTSDKQATYYSSSLEVDAGIKKLTKEAEELDRKILSVCETQKKLVQTIAAARQSQKSKNDNVENQLKLYEELISPVELTSLISDQRFEDYHSIAQKILVEVPMLAKKWQ